MFHGLLVDQHVAVDLPRRRPVERSVERGLRHADRERPDAGPEPADPDHRDGEAAAARSRSVGWKRWSVLIAPAKPRSTAPSTSWGSTRTPWNVSRPIACGATMS